MENAQGSAAAAMSVEEAISFFCNEVLPLSQEIPPINEGGIEVLELLSKFEADGYTRISPLDLVSSELAERAIVAREALIKARKDNRESNHWEVIDQWDIHLSDFYEREKKSTQEMRVFVLWVAKTEKVKYMETWNTDYLFQKPKQNVA